jgi:hypothetical protein
MRKFLSHMVVLALLISGLAANYAKAADSTVVFVLKRTDSGYQIDQMPIAKNNALKLDVNRETGIIDIILPVGPGGSGNLIQDGLIRSFVVYFDGQSLSVTSELASGKQQSLPPQSLSDLRDYKTHLSVTGGDGSSARFIVNAYSEVHIDSIGPLMDMFGGHMPMNPGDYSIFLNTERIDQGHAITGEMPLFYSGRYLFVDVISPTGKKGLFAVDIGAASSIMRESFLPDDVGTSEVFMMEYSSGGTRQLKYAPGGATGPVENVVGTATLDFVTVGGLKFEQAAFNVMESLPDLHGRRIDGIIGLDILKAARFLTLRYNADNGNAASLRFSNDVPEDDFSAQIPFVSIRKIMYVRGQIDSRDILFILDSGSPGCMLQPEAAEALKSVVILDSSITYKGAGGQVEEGKLAMIERMSLSGIEFTDVPCDLGNLFNLSTLVPGQLGGLIGNSILSRLSSVIIDFEKSTVSLIK